MHEIRRTAEGSISDTVVEQLRSETDGKRGARQVAAISELADCSSQVTRGARERQLRNSDEEANEVAHVSR